MTITNRPLLIAPSILASDFARLGEECRAVLAGGADWLHVDVMDGHYVPNLTIGLPVLKALRKALPDAYLDCHLMIDNPDVMAKEFAEAGADMVTFHPEASRHPHRTLQDLRARGVKAGLALNPGTGLHWVDHLLEELDMVLLMSVNPGFGGQSFIESTLPKLRELRKKLNAAGVSLDIQVDGGVKVSNAGAVREAGANVLVAGSAVYGTEDYAAAIAAIRQSAEGLA